MKLDWVGYKAARYAVLRWHYSRTMPAGKLMKLGVWEDGNYCGCVMFGRGASPSLGSQYGLRQVQLCELVRVALDRHATPTSKIVAIAVRMVRRQCPGLRLIVSFADTAQGHTGTIYQACGWAYTGATGQQESVRIHGAIWHKRSVGARYGTTAMSTLRRTVDPDAALVPDAPKHKYVMPLDNAMAEQIRPLAKPYPKKLTPRRK